MDYLRITLPAFKNAYIVHTGKIGVRESRRICGEYVLELNDIINSVRFDDAVAQGAFPVDIHQPDGDSMVYKKVAQAYQIPARCLTSKNFFNLFMCGRCISAGHEVIASARITATSMATGQAAGVMAAMQAENGRIDIKSLRNELIKQNCLI
jgi:hypothetical protein